MKPRGIHHGQEPFESEPARPSDGATHPLIALRDRLRAAAGPDVELDSEIHTAIGRGDELRYRCAPAYTASLDAAVSLVPKGWVWEVSQAFAKEPSFTAKICESPSGAQFRNFGAYRKTAGGKTMPMDEYLKALRWERSPALALCLARVEYEIALVREMS